MARGLLVSGCVLQCLLTAATYAITFAGRCWAGGSDRDSSQTATGYRLTYTDKFNARTTALIDGTHTLQASDFLFNTNNSELFALTATRIWLVAAGGRATVGRSRCSNQRNENWGYPFVHY